VRLRVDTSAVQSFIVSRAPVPKVERESGRQRADTQTGELLWSVQVMAIDDSGGEVLTLTVPGEPRVVPGQQVRVDGLVAIPWEQNGRNGVAFRALAVVPADVPQSRTAPKPAA
jgi:hypothetical protein